MSRMLFALMVVSLLASGCQSPATKPSSLPTGKSSGTIRFEVIAMYVSAKGTYKTTQRHTIDFDAKRLTVQSNEPEGAIYAVYHQGRFSAQGLNFPRAEQLPFGMINAAMAEMLLYVFDVPVKGIPQTAAPAAQEWFLGKSYQTHRLTTQTAGALVIYQNPQSEQLQFVEWYDNNQHHYLAVPDRWRFIPALNRRLPTKVEIYDIRRSPADKQLLAQLLFTPTL